MHSTKSVTEDLKSSHLQNNKINSFLKDQSTNHFRSSKAVSSSVKNMFLSHIGPEGIQSVSMCTSYQSHAEISTDVVQRDVTPSTFTVRSDCSAAKANKTEKTDDLLKSSETLGKKRSLTTNVA